MSYEKFTAFSFTKLCHYFKQYYDFYRIFPASENLFLRMKKLKKFEEQFYTELKNEYPEAELEMMFNLLVENYLNIPKSPDQQEEIVLENFQLQEFEDALSRLKKNEPIQYILGEVDFFGRPFKVNKNVHVPRPETETMVKWVKEDFMGLQQQKGSTLTLLDIGTGCGLLPITLGKELPLETTAVDLSEKALEVARENAEINQADVEFIQADVLKWDKLPKQFDIIVSNPPYVLEKSKRDVQRKILDHEPPVALYVKDEDPMIFNRKIAELAKESLSPNGLVYVEINKYLGAETSKVFAENGFKTEIRKDVFGSDRTVKAYRE